MADAPRVRFAPSPTGFFHVGGARTALFNWLFARHHRGTFILRIEDTDVERNRPEWVAGIESALRWLGLDWDEGPYFQSARTDRHREAAEKLYADGCAYYCDCTREVIERRTRANPTPGYDGYCAERGLGPGPGRALRFRTPDEGATTVVDVIRGPTTFEHVTIEDFVILRSSRQAPFILANVADDIDGAITYVIRGEEHLPNTPKALLLWEALGAGPPPVWAHVPLLVNERRQKLSKRRDKVALESYRDEGYLAEAVRNYLALLGWAPRDGREILTLEEMTAEFRLEDVNNSPAFFDVRKLTHFNAEYIRALAEATFVQRSLPWLESTDAPWPPEAFDLEVFNKIAGLVQTRVQTLAEVPGMVDFLFVEEPELDAASWEKHVAGVPAAREVLTGVLAAYAEVDWKAPAVEAATWEVGERLGLNRKRTQFPVRVAVTGRALGPPLFESLEVLGRARTLRRIERALARLG